MGFFIYFFIHETKEFSDFLIGRHVSDVVLVAISHDVARYGGIGTTALA